MYSTRRTSGSHPLIPPDPALSPPASVLPPPASVLVPPDSPFLHRRIPDSRFIVAPRAPHITIQFLQGKGSLDLFSLDLPLPASSAPPPLRSSHPQPPSDAPSKSDNASGAGTAVGEDAQQDAGGVGWLDLLSAGTPGTTVPSPQSGSTDTLVSGVGA
ncbi:hypothetical protein LshimejAT787_1204710 [Lyophyllum shimeji]|uniref:Uncharacterized protein n=1 Tax=Lyophyllum shimeji TaxID=47721 RepID=A0A9P3PXF2_LYOSH|nr:hypothetical protein LshimejAT787_1204710 [Lyophyllum shimeji]